MFLPVEMYKTSDGKLFDTEERASEHVADLCREIIAARLEPLKGPLSANEIYRVVMAIIPDGSAAASLARAMMRHTD